MKQAAKRPWDTSAVQREPHESRLDAVKQTLFTIEADHITVVVVGFGARAGQIAKSLDEGEDALGCRFKSDDTDFSLILDLAKSGGQDNVLLQRHLMSDLLVILWDSGDQHSRDGAVSLAGQMVKPGRLVLSMDVANSPSMELADFSNLILLPEPTPMHRRARVYAAYYLATYLYGLLVALLRESMVCVDPSDLFDLFEMGSVSRMAVGQGSGEDRVSAALEQALDDARQQGFTIGPASGVFLNVTGPPDVNLAEVPGALSELYEMLSDDGRLVFAIHPDPSLSDSVSVNILVVGN